LEDFTSHSQRISCFTGAIQLNTYDTIKYNYYKNRSSTLEYYRVNRDLYIGSAYHGPWCIHTQCNDLYFVSMCQTSIFISPPTDKDIRGNCFGRQKNRFSITKKMNETTFGVSLQTVYDMTGHPFYCRTGTPSKLNIRIFNTN
jgi:hypothetical protein